MCGEELSPRHLDQSAASKMGQSSADVDRSSIKLEVRSQAWPMTRRYNVRIFVHCLQVVAESCVDMRSVGERACAVPLIQTSHSRVSAYDPSLKACGEELLCVTMVVSM